MGDSSKLAWLRCPVSGRVFTTKPGGGDFINSIKCDKEDEPPIDDHGRRLQGTPRADKRHSVAHPKKTASERSAGGGHKSDKELTRMKEACESLRFLVFGTVVTETKRKDGRPFYEQRCGTREEVMQLHKVWNQMDEDGSGDVEFQEFLSFFSRSKADRLLGMRCVKYLVGNAAYDEDGAAQGCRIEDMMRLIWLKAEPEDTAMMLVWFREAEFEKDRVSTPPLLPPKKRRQITDNFTADVEGRITWADLNDSGLVDGYMLKDLREKYTQAGNSSHYITEKILLEMLCPNGYRAHEDVSSVVDKEGVLLVKVKNELFEGWVAAHTAGRLDEDAEEGD
jgi:hypothetical protein